MKAELENLGYLLGPDIDAEEIPPEFVDYLEALERKPLVVDRKVFDDFLATQKKSEPVVLQRSKEGLETYQNLKIIKNYQQERNYKKLDVSDWTLYFNTRYDEISGLLMRRIDLKDAVSLNRLNSSNGRTYATIIAMVSDVRTTSKGNLLLRLEDPTGDTLAIINQSKKELVLRSKELVLDEVAGFKGSKSGDFFFIQEIIFPDMPELPAKKAPMPGKAAFISDLHIGSNRFLPEQFEAFINWINGKDGSEKQKELAKSIRYLFVGGDLVDGVGVYPEQLKELTEPDIYKQYEAFSEYMKRIPEYIKIIAIPGNHDVVRLEEPQPAIYKEFSKELRGYGNIELLSNPTYANVHSSNGFEGFNILNYHGYSFDSLVSDVEPVRKMGGYDRGDKIMEFLLRKRHLSPTFGWVPVAPMAEDFLFIDKVPDIFVAGHIHKSKVGSYKNIITIASSCWQGMTLFQERVGHHPEPGRVPIIDLQTRKITMMNFI
jgi:DNA polymerase II small subunit